MAASSRAYNYVQCSERKLGVYSDDVSVSDRVMLHVATLVCRADDSRSF